MTNQYTSSSFRFEYDELGNLVREDLDVNCNGVLDIDSDDRISKTEMLYKWYGNVLRRETAGYVCSRNTAGAAEKLSSGWRRERLTGLGGGLVSEVAEYDPENDVNTTRIYVDAAAKTETRKTD